MALGALTPLCGGAASVPASLLPAAIASVIANESDRIIKPKSNINRCKDGSGRRYGLHKHLRLSDGAFDDRAEASKWLLMALRYKFRWLRSYS